MFHDVSVRLFAFATVFRTHNINHCVLSMYSLCLKPWLYQPSFASGGRGKGGRLAMSVLPPATRDYDETSNAEDAFLQNQCNRNVIQSFDGAVCQTPSSS